MISRVLGLVRLQVQSYYFGAGLVTDAFVAAFRIPNLLRDLFAEGALSAAFVPTFTAEREHHGHEAAFRLANRLMTLLTVILGALSVAIFLGAPWILKVFAPGFEDDKLALATTMTPSAAWAGVATAVETMAASAITAVKICFANIMLLRDKRDI